MRKFIIPFLKRLLKIAEGPQPMAFEADRSKIEKELKPQKNNLNKKTKGNQSSMAQK